MCQEQTECAPTNNSSLLGLFPIYVVLNYYMFSGILIHTQLILLIEENWRLYSRMAYPTARLHKRRIDVRITSRQ